MNDPLAMRVFAEHLARSPGRNGPGIDELCRAHPELEESLRELARRRAEAEIDAPHVSTVHGRKLGRPPGARTRYVLLGELARGGMGVVLHVWDTLLERAVAMKVLDTEAEAETKSEAKSKRPQDAEETLARFLTEARIAGQLQHPGVVPIHDLGADEHGRVYFTMPLCEGRTLDEIFELARSRAEGWSLERVVGLLEKACEVIAYAHSRGVIHRDLKPANLIVSASGQVYVVDWGLAKVLDPRGPARRPAADAESEPEAERPSAKEAEREPDETLAGTVAGTPLYMAPEQAQGRVEDVSVRADVYAFGAMLYRLLVGRAPYAPRHGTDDAAKTVELIRRGAPTPVSLLVPDAPAELVAICEKAMAREPKDRHGSVEELARELHAFLASRESRSEQP
jgi:serine/threonine protein kinase